MGIEGTNQKKKRMGIEGSFGSQKNLPSSVEQKVYGSLLYLPTYVQCSILHLNITGKLLRKLFIQMVLESYFRKFSL